MELAPTFARIEHRDTAGLELRAHRIFDTQAQRRRVSLCGSAVAERMDTGPEEVEIVEDLTRMRRMFRWQAFGAGSDVRAHQASSTGTWRGSSNELSMKVEIYADATECVL